MKKQWFNPEMEITSLNAQNVLEASPISSYDGVVNDPGTWDNVQEV